MGFLEEGEEFRSVTAFSPKLENSSQTLKEDIWDTADHESLLHWSAFGCTVAVMPRSPTSRDCSARMF